MTYTPTVNSEHRVGRCRTTAYLEEDLLSRCHNCDSSFCDRGRGGGTTEVTCDICTEVEVDVDDEWVDERIHNSDGGVANPG